MTAAPRPTLYLIDGHAQFFRAYHAIRSGLTSPVTKEPTNLTFGFVGMLLKVLREYKPEYLAVVIDVSGDRETFRSEIYPEYKATRKETPNDFHPQVERCIAFLKQMGIPVIGEAGVEADDVIATLVRRLRKERPELRIRIISRDKDLTQLLDEGVELFDVHKDAGVTAEDVFETPGVEPRHVADILALMGDNVDNVPGIEGVGPKTAAGWIVKYGSIEGLYSHLEEIKGKKRESLEHGRATVDLSRRLIALKTDVDVHFDLQAARSNPKELPVEELLGTLRELGFGRYQNELRAVAGVTEEEGAPSAVGTREKAQREESSASGAASTTPSTPEKSATSAKRRGGDDNGATGLLFGDGAANAAPIELATGAYSTDAARYACIRTEAELKAFVQQIHAKGEVAIDTETDGLDVLSANLCGLCLSLGPGHGVYVPVRSPEPDTHLTPAVVMAIVKPMLEDPSIRKIGHNLKFDINVLRTHGVRLAGASFDSMVASYLVDASRSSHKMDVLALALLNYMCTPIEAVIGTGKVQRTFDQAPLELATKYAAEDADVTMRLRDALLPQLEQMNLKKLFEEVEMPLVEVLAEMEFNGIVVNGGELDRQRDQLAKRIDELRRHIVDASPLGGGGFNPDSPKQLAAVLFNKPDGDPPGLGLKVVKRNKTGPSTDVEVLERLAGDPAIESPLPALMVEYRQLTKLMNTYLVALKEAIHPKDGRVHASFNQTVAVTGRISSSDPNLQNIPIRTEIGREIRRAFIAAPGHVLITADYSQIELRMLAHLSNDGALIQAFQSGVDIHTAVAAEVFKIEPSAVTPAQRGSAKMVNFGIVYGITAFGLARRLTMAGTHTSTEEAGRIISDYKARYAGIDRFLDECVRHALEKGYVETILGRRRAVPQVHSNNPAERALGERLAINTVVQGSAADLIKLAMIDLHKRLPERFSTSKAGPPRLVIQIHDELVYETPSAIVDGARDFIVERMEQAMPLRVPLVVGSAWSENWIDA